ncbi:hypothetical protein TCON_1838 [Astathelohania contejeani]|uniref:Uncharacterized protein n=1 Tax=Astathelohania contejeani TaxID=164912 RepID=A0ABQ7HXN8_9MICR|nr:hypothetical protein TCON_1838 [Thelohania contejeani]
MTDNAKVEESKKEKLAKQAEESEKKVKETIGKIENSTVAHYIPTSVEKINFIDIVKITMLIMFISTIPIYVILDSNANRPFRVINWIMKGIRFIMFWVGIVGAGFDAIVVFMRLDSLFRIVLLTKLIKDVAIVLSILITSFNTWIVKIFAISFMLYNIFLDAVFVYYLAIFFKRLESKDYDDDGNPIVAAKSDEAAAKPEATEKEPEKAEV